MLSQENKLFQRCLLTFDAHCTYITGHYIPSVRIIDLVPYTTCVVYVNFTYNLKSTPNDRFFEKFFLAILFTFRVFAKNLLRGNRRRNTFCIFILMSGLGFERPGFFYLIFVEVDEVMVKN